MTLTIRTMKKLETLIYLEIRKQTEQIWYFKQSHMTDFIGKWKGRWNAIQVSWALNDNDTIQRELKNLIKTCQQMNIQYGYVVTRSTDESITLDDIEIQIVSATNFWNLTKFLLKTKMNYPRALSISG